MSNVAQREDIYNETIVLRFTSHFANQKLLDMIYILTYADMSGVGNDIYNSFNAKLIRRLYKQSMEVLDNTQILDEASKRGKKESVLKKHDDFIALKKSEQKKILTIPSNLLFLRYTPQHIVNIAKKAFETKHYAYHISNDNYLTIEIIRNQTFNLSYLLAKLSPLEVVNMDICKLFNEQKYFRIDFSSSIDEEDLARIEAIIEASFSRKSPYDCAIIKIDKETLAIDCEHSKTTALMTLTSKNQKGLLCFIMQLFDQMEIDIVTAKIHTGKNRVRDMFLIQKNGNFCHNVDNIVEKLTGER
ncbi:MAG: hypothetical protein Q9M36_10455 [Sulfurovum sp.]|nr:hypothetical protein [Sulfurovum sp.]